MNDWPRLDGAILEASAPMAIMRRVVEQSLKLLPGAEGAVVELADGETMIYTCCAGSLASAVGLRLGMDDSLSGLAVRTATTLRCDDANTDDRVDREACVRVGAVSMLCVPLCEHEHPVGVLKVTSSKTAAFDADDTAVLDALAGFVTTVITTSAQLSRATDDLLQARGGGLSAGGGPGRSEQTSRFVANVLKPGLADDVAARARTEDALEDPAILGIVYQPEFELGNGRLVAAEALARFMSDPYRPPNQWFADAHRAGLGAELETVAVARAFRDAGPLPGCAIAVNLGPVALQDPACVDVLKSFDPDRLIIELTEHVAVEDYPMLHRRLAELRRAGVRLAVDDTGSGFASFSHIVKLAPDIIKLDLEIVQGIDIDPVRRSLATAVVAFARDTGSKVTAEGIETRSELETVTALGIDYGQGYYLGRPVGAHDMSKVAPPPLRPRARPGPSSAAGAPGIASR